MTQFHAIIPGVEVSGRQILAFLTETDSFENVSLEILSRHGLSNVKPKSWYSQQKWLDAMKEFSAKIGNPVLFKIGLRIGIDLDIPSNVRNLEKALTFIDINHHKNHRFKGKIMYNPKTKKFKEGVGYYKYKKIGKNEIRMTCNSPYPCEFDRGLITSVVLRNVPKNSKAYAIHDDSKPCRKEGSSSCEYIISW